MNNNLQFALIFPRGFGLQPRGVKLHSQGQRESSRNCAETTNVAQFLQNHQYA